LLNLKSIVPLSPATCMLSCAISSGATENSDDGLASSTQELAEGLIRLSGPYRSCHAKFPRRDNLYIHRSVARDKNPLSPTDQCYDCTSQMPLFTHTSLSRNPTLFNRVTLGGPAEFSNPLWVSSTSPFPRTRRVPREREDATSIWGRTRFSP
jgi:hypothetical protein